MPADVAHQSVTSARHHETTSTDAQSRRREMVCNLLTQIFAVAERKRAAKSSARRQALGIEGEEGEEEETEAQDAISLIELIQASYSVFERYGIGPPDDAVYHRYLLSLSINPERDWRKKILSFDLGAPPRVKRLCSHQHGAAAASTTRASAGMKIREAEFNSFEEERRRHRTGSKHSNIRQASPLLRPKETPKKVHGNQDRFGDMLSLDSPIQRIRAGDDDKSERIAPMPDNGDDSTGKESAKRRDRIAAGERKLQMLTTSIEQWRATQAVKQLVDQNKLQDRKTRQQQATIPLCIHALFHWIALCLPEKLDFQTMESPRALPLCILRRISVDLKVFKYSAKRVWMWQMRSFLQQWRREARAVKSLRVRMIVRQRAAVLETAFQCIQRWRLFTEARKCSTDRAQWVAQRWGRSTLRTHLNHWRRIFRTRQRQHQVGRHYTSRMVRKVLRSWQDAVERQREERCRFEMARKRRVFSRWKREKERKQAARALLCVSNDQRRLRVLGDSWTKLRANVLRNKATRARMDLWRISSRKRRQHQVIRLWRMAIDQQRDFRERRERFHRFSRRRHLALAFGAWAGWTERQISLGKSLSDVREARAEKQLAACFENWRKHHADASGIESKLVAGVIQLRRRGVWNRWRKSTATRSATRCLGSVYSFHLLGKTFLRWKRYARRRSVRHCAFLECQQLHQTNVLALHWKLLVANLQSQQQKQLKAAKLGERKLLKLMTVCFVSWQVHVARRRECRLRGEQLKYSVRRRRLIDVTWTTWREAFWWRNGARLADDQLQKCQKSSVFRAWKEFAHSAHHRRSRTLKAVEMLDTFHLNACFRQWKQTVSSKRQLLAHAAVVQQRTHRRLLRSRWKCWRHALKTKRGQHERLSAVASRRQSRQLYATFHSWKATWAIRKRHRRLLQSTQVTSKQRVLEAHFNAWKRSQDAAAARECQVLEAQGKLLRFRAKRAVRYWNSLRLEQRKRSCLLAKSLALRRQTLLSYAFRGLLRYRLSRKQKKTRESQAASHRRNHLIRVAFVAWSQWWRTRELTALKLDATRDRLERLKMQRSIQTLKLNAQSSKRVKEAHNCAVARGVRHMRAASFSRWKLFIAQRRGSRRDYAARAVSLRNFRVRRKIQKWREFVQTRKTMKLSLTRAAKALTASQLQLHFKNWRRFVDRRIVAQALEKKADEFRYFCLLPRYFKAWKTFVLSRKRDQELLLRARGLRCHQLESRSFRAWTQFSLHNRLSKCAEAQWRNRALSGSFASWRRFESRQKKRKRDRICAVNFYEGRLYHRVLREWSATARRERLQRRCAELWYQNTSRRVFDAWTRHVLVLQSTREFLANKRSHILTRVLRAWKEGVEHKAQRLQGVQERFALMWVRDTRANTFARWKRYARLRSVIRRKLAGQREVLLYDVVKHWRRVVICQQQRRQAELLVSERTKLRLVRICLIDWRQKARTLRCVKTLSERVTQSRTASDLRRRLRRWKQFALLSIEVKQFVHRRDLELMRLVLIAGFQQFAALKHKEKNLIRQIRRVHEAFQKEWLARKVAQRVSVLAACEELRRSGYSKRLLAAAWSEWTSFHSKKQAQQAAIRQLRVQASRLEDVGSPLSTAQLAGMLRRWQTVQVARVFDHWSDVTRSRRQTRLNSLQAIELWHQTQCGRHFLAWVRFCHEQSHQRRIRAMNFRAKLKRSWKWWRVFAALSLSKKAMNLRARQLHAKHVYANAFETWRAVAASLRLKRAQILELYHSSRLRLLAALLAEWRQFAATEKTKRMQTTAARVVYEDKLKRRSFTSWKTNVAGICYHRRQLQINTERLQVLLLCSSFRAWHSWSRQHKKLRTVVQTLSSRCNTRQIAQVFAAWHLHSERNFAVRHQVSSFLRFRRMQKAVNALRALVQEQQYVRTIRQKAQVFRTAVSGTQVSAIFLRWKTLAALSRKIRAAALRWESAFLHKVWNALVLLHNIEKERRATISRAELHHRNFRLRKALTQWGHVKVEKQHFRAVCGKLLSRWRMQTAYRCLCALHDHAAYRKALRASEAAIRGKLRSAALLRAWYAWRKLILISRSGKRRMLQRCLAAWIRSRESRKVLHAFQEQIQARVLRSTQRQCMKNWREFIATLKIEKAMTLMSTAFAGTQLLKRVWLCWMKFVAQSRASKAKMRGALAHMQLQTQFKAFRALQTHALQQKRKTHANARAVAFRCYRLRAQSFLEWRAVVVDRINRRRKLAQYLDVMQHSVQKRSFGGWYAFTTRRKSLREKVSQSLALRTQMCSRVVFRTWKSFVMKTRQNRKARNFSAAKASAHALTHWKQYVVLCKVERMIGAGEQRQVESSFLSWRKAVAAMQQIRAFRAKSARRQWSELVGTVFAAWKLRSRTHAQCRKLLASVAVGSHLRFRFMLWQKFTAHRKRLANLLLVVADPPALLPIDTSVVEGEDTATAQVESIVAEGDVLVADCNDSKLDTATDNHEEETSADDRQLVSLGQELAKKARVLQRFEVTWDLPQAWHRWRQIFHAQLFYRMRRLQLHFICWQRFAHQQRRSRWIVIKLTRQRQAASAQTVFLAWKELVTRVKQLQRDRLRERELWVLVSTEMARRERKQLKTHWRAWKFHVEEARHLQSSLDAYHRARLLTKYWLVWSHDFRTVMVEVRRESQRAKAHMDAFHVRRAVRSLRDNQQRTKRARLVLEYFGNRHNDTLLPEVLARWRQWCQRQKEIARCIGELRLRKTQRHFVAWKTWTNTQRWQRVAVENSQLKSAEQRRREVWRRWRRFTKNQVVKDLALQQAMVFHIRNRLRRRWLQYTQRAVQLRDQAEAAHVQLCVFQGHRAVSRWRDFSRARRLRRLYQRFVLRKHLQLWQSAVKHALATRFDEFLLRSKAKKLLMAWRQVAVKHLYWRQLCASFAGKQEIRTAQRSFLRWQQFVNSRQGKRLAAMHAEQRLLRKVWRYWSHATLASQLQRHEQYEHAAEHEALTLLRRSLSVWQAAVKKQRERRFVLLSCVVKLKSVAGQRVQEVVFRAWRRVVDHERRCRTASLKRDCRIAKRALSYWFVWTQERQRRRQQLQSAGHYYAQRLKSAVFFYWQTYALAWQDAAKPMARRHDRQLSLPSRLKPEPQRSDVFEDSDDSDADVRRPTSPVVKRLRQKTNANRTRTGEEEEAAAAESSGTVALSDAVEISMDVKKRLLLLGKWKPQGNGRRFLSSSS